MFRVDASYKIVVSHIAASSELVQLYAQTSAERAHEIAAIDALKLLVPMLVGDGQKLPV